MKALLFVHCLHALLLDPLPRPWPTTTIASGTTAKILGAEVLHESVGARKTIIRAATIMAKESAGNSMLESVRSC